MPDSNQTGKKTSLMKADEQAWLDQQETRTSCVCGWTFTGTALEGRERAAAHRAEQHPELRPSRRQRGRLKVPSLDPEAQAEGRARGAVVAEALARLKDVA